MNRTIRYKTLVFNLVQDNLVQDNLVQYSQLRIRPFSTTVIRKMDRDNSNNTSNETTQQEQNIPETSRSQKLDELTYEASKLLKEDAELRGRRDYEAQRLDQRIKKVEDDVHPVTERNKEAMSDETYFKLIDIEDEESKRIKLINEAKARGEYTEEDECSERYNLIKDNEKCVKALLEDEGVAVEDKHILSRFLNTNNSL